MVDASKLIIPIGLFILFVADLATGQLNLQALLPLLPTLLSSLKGGGDGGGGGLSGRSHFVTERKGIGRYVLITCPVYVAVDQVLVKSFRVLSGFNSFR